MRKAVLLRIDAGLLSKVERLRAELAGKTLEVSSRNEIICALIERGLTAARKGK